MTCFYYLPFAQPIKRWEFQVSSAKEVAHKDEEDIVEEKAAAEAEANTTAARSRREGG